MTVQTSLIHPMDEHNQALVALTHPAHRVNPTPADRYQLVVVGGGPAGLVCAFGAAGLGARVALVEKGLLGGDCLIVGCVPSKALLASAHVAHTVRNAEAFGVSVGGDVTVDFGAVMTRMRALRAGIAPHDSVARLEDAGIDVFLGAGTFTGPDTLEVEGATLSFSRAVVATGARAARPPIPGLEDVATVDNHTLFELTELPRRLVVLGGGPIGVEMAQAFARFGSEVTVVDMAPRVIPRDDPDAAELVAASLQRDGVRLVLGAKVTRCERAGDDSIVVVQTDGGERRIVGDTILLALGRQPNVEGIGLEAAGVGTDRKGVVVDDKLRTANTRIYAAGDVAGRWQFTHSADAMARIVLQNALVLPTKGVASLVIPWATYTDPEVAHVGPSFEALAARDDVQSFRAGLDETDRGVTDGTVDGFAKLWIDGKGIVIAGTVVGPAAGDIIHELTLAVTHGLSIGQIANTVHAYPNRSEAVWKAAGAYNKTRFTPMAARLLRAWMAWRLG